MVPLFRSAPRGAQRVARLNTTTRIVYEKCPLTSRGHAKTDNVTQSWAGGTLRLATHVHLVLGALRELQLAVAQGEQGVVLAATDVLARMDVRAQMPTSINKR